jgi:hypothetical protein
MLQTRAPIEEQEARVTITALSIEVELILMLFSPLIVLGVFELANRLVRYVTRQSHFRTH